jgi:hypothetical protein
MLTRLSVSHPVADPQVPAPVNTPGAIVQRPTGSFNNNQSIVAAMPIARPNSSPSPNGAPFYLGAAYSNPAYELIRGGTTRLIPSSPKLEMDPTDPTTYQREYRFT